jgi:pimeloyl-ACP methyl ester carboxylesterase
VGRVNAGLSPAGRLVDVGGFRLHITSAGSGGPTVVCDAALAGSTVSWTLTAPGVARFARICCYDRAGLGWSDPGPMPRTAGRSADELRVLLDRAGEQPPYLLVGHSFGGLVMRIFAARYRADTAALVLVDPAHPEDWVKPAPKEQMLIDRGVRLCRQGAVAARFGLTRFVSLLVAAGALGPAWAIVKLVTGGRLSARDEGILTPMWKLPPGARRPLRYVWTQRKFFESLGSHIGSIGVSARETLDASAGSYGDLPLVTISSTDPGEYRLRQQDALARLSTRGRHIVASRSSHWIPLDEPQLIVSVIEELHARLGRENDLGCRF